MQIIKEKIQVLYSEAQIQARVKEIAAQINNDYKDCECLVVIGVLKGAFVFVADLLRELTINTQVEFIRLSSYDESTQSSGTVRLYDLSLPILENKDVLLIDDIVDSGRTAKFLLDFIRNQSRVRSVKLATLFDKPCRRLEALQEINPDYCCFEVDDKFILGYGLDYDQKFRELPYIGFIEGFS